MDQANVFAVAQWLRSDERVIFEDQSLGIPGEILSMNHAVSHGDAFAMPEGLLRVKLAVFKESALGIL